MLVLFIHGVATANVTYADRLKSLIREEFIHTKQPLPHFYASFWGDILGQKDKIWNWIHQDLQSLKREYPDIEIAEIFRYQEFREGFISQFFGDALTYFNAERGAKIRY